MKKSLVRINSSELFLISNDLDRSGIVAVFSGRAIAAPSSFDSSAVLPNYIFRFTGSSSAAASTSIGLASFSGGTSGTVSGTMDQYTDGTASSHDLTGTYAFMELSGRLGVSGPGATTSSSVCYLTNPFDGVSGFCISMDASASLGIFDKQPAMTYSNSSLSGNLYFGSSEPGDSSVPDLSGIISISSGTLEGVQDASARSGLSLASPINATLSIEANGSGNLGAHTVAVTNGAVPYFIDQTGTSPPLIQVFER